MKKNIISILSVILLLVVGVCAQEYLSRQPTPTELFRVAGLRNNIQLEVERLSGCTLLAGGPNPYTCQATNGIILVRTNSAAGIIQIELPNPTNNYGRVFTIVPLGACQPILTNSSDYTAVSFTNPFNDATAATYQMASNVVVKALSTGTNYVLLRY